MAVMQRSRKKRTFKLYTWCRKAPVLESCSIIWSIIFRNMLCLSVYLLLLRNPN